MFIQITQIMVMHCPKVVHIWTSKFGFVHKSNSRSSGKKIFWFPPAGVIFGAATAGWNVLTVFSVLGLGNGNQVMRCGICMKAVLLLWRSAHKGLALWVHVALGEIRLFLVPIHHNNFLLAQGKKAKYIQPSLHPRINGIVFLLLLDCGS